LEYYDYVSTITENDVPVEITILCAKLLEALQNFMEEIGVSKEAFDSKIKQNIKEIMFQETVNNSDDDNGKYEKNIIFIKKTLLKEEQKIILVLAHELVHMLGKGDSSAGLIKYSQNIPQFIRKTLQDQINGLSKVSYLNEMVTEYVAVKVVVKYFGAIDNKYSFCFDDGSKAYIVSKCVSYKEIMVYCETINYIFDDKLIEIYFTNSMNFMDFLKQEKYKYIRKAFFEFYHCYIHYINKTKNWNKPFEVHSKRKFNKMSDAYKRLLKKYIMCNSLSKEQINLLMECLQSNPIYIDEASVSVYENFAEILKKLIFE